MRMAGSLQAPPWGEKARLGPEVSAELTKPEYSLSYTLGAVDRISLSLPPKHRAHKTGGSQIMHIGHRNIQ